MRLEEGKFYVTADGRKVGPMERGRGIWHCYMDGPLGSQVWNIDGSVMCEKDGGGPNDYLIAEWTNEPVNEDDNKMKIEVGKYYLRADGRKAGPAEALAGDNYPFNVPYGDWSLYHAYTADGVSCIDDDDARLIAEWTPARDPELTSPYGDNNHPLPDTPKTWGEMTDKEKGALLLADHEGKVIEVWHDDLARFDTPLNGGLPFRDWHAYRIRPEPKRERVSLIGGYASGWGFYQSDTGVVNKSHVVTFDLIDGEPDLGSIKMERINDQPN